MKKKSLYGIFAILFIVIMAGACSSNSNEYTVSSDCYISGFTLGQMKRIIHTTSSKGEDSTYTIAFKGSLYKIVIDQVDGVITNVEPFPMGTQLNAVLATISGTGLFVYAPEADTTMWTSFSTADSIDFTEPLLFRAYALDGSGYHQYRATFKVRQNNPLEYTWQQFTGIPALNNRQDAKLLFLDRKAVVLSSSEDGTVFATTTGTIASDGLPTDNSWTEQVCTGLPATADVNTALVFRNAIWLSTTTGKVFHSNNGADWTEVVQDATMLREVHLVAASETTLYAFVWRNLGPYAFGQTDFMASSADGEVWNLMDCEKTPNTRPSASVSYEQENGNSRVLMVGTMNGSTSETLSVWGLLEENNESWVLFTDENSSSNQLPCWKHPNLLAYDDILMALGGNTWTGNHTPLDALYISYDNGLNWKQDSYLTAPEALVNALTDTTAPVTAAISDEYIWLVAGEQLWCVRFNGYGE